MTSMALKLKASISRVPFSWDNLPTSPSASTVSEPSSPPTQWLDAKHMKIFGAEPLRPEVGIVKCNDCGKPVIKSAIAEHAGTYHCYKSPYFRSFLTEHCDIKDKCRIIRSGGKKGVKAETGLFRDNFMSWARIKILFREKG